MSRSSSPFTAAFCVMPASAVAQEVPRGPQGGAGHRHDVPRGVRPAARSGVAPPRSVDTAPAASLTRADIRVRVAGPRPARRCAWTARCSAPVWRRSR